MLSKYNRCVMPVRAVCKPHSPDLKKRRSKRQYSLWRSLLERPPPVPESWVRDPLGVMVWTRGGYISMIHFHLIFI